MGKFLHSEFCVWVLLLLLLLLLFLHHHIYKFFCVFLFLVRLLIDKTNTQTAVYLKNFYLTCIFVVFQNRSTFGSWSDQEKEMKAQAIHRCKERIARNLKRKKRNSIYNNSGNSNSSTNEKNKNGVQKNKQTYKSISEKQLQRLIVFMCLIYQCEESFCLVFLFFKKDSKQNLIIFQLFESKNQHKSARVKKGRIRWIPELQNWRFHKFDYSMCNLFSLHILHKISEHSIEIFS